MNYMARTAHKKSRRGCATCKARHVKCDESKPSCVNCTTLQKRCAYLDNQAPPSSSSSPGTVTLPTGITNDFVYVTALNQWCKHTQEIYCAVDDQHHPGTIMLDIAIKHPFLLHGLLAMSCFHLGIAEHSLRDTYIGHSHQLLAQGMAGFNSIATNSGGFDESNIMAAFIFANVAGLCKFAHLFSTMHESVDQFIESFVDTLTMLRGVNIVLGPWWPFITTSALFKALNLTNVSKHQVVDETETIELSKAREILAQADFDTQTKAVCQQIVIQLQIIYNESARSRLEEDIQNFPESVWFIRFPAEFHALLIDKSPEALVIVAHMTPLLHRRRKYWLVRNSGEVLLNGISDYLGTTWSPWLEGLHHTVRTVTEAQNSGEVVNV